MYTPYCAHDADLCLWFRNADVKVEQCIELVLVIAWEGNAQELKQVDLKLVPYLRRSSTARLASALRESAL